jgi:hypothetical protein
MADAMLPRLRAVSAVAHGHEANICRRYQDAAASECLIVYS